jgi:hypothetical protein
MSLFSGLPNDIIMKIIRMSPGARDVHETYYHPVMRELEQLAEDCGYVPTDEMDEDVIYEIDCDHGLLEFRFPPPRYNLHTM